MSATGDEIKRHDLITGFVGAVPIYLSGIQGTGTEPIYPYIYLRYNKNLSKQICLSIVLQKFNISIGSCSVLEAKYDQNG